MRREADVTSQGEFFIYALFFHLRWVRRIFFIKHELAEMMKAEHIFFLKYLPYNFIDANFLLLL